jgi:hypothetical protein
MQAWIAFRRATGLRDQPRNSQAVPVFHEGMAL